MTTDRTDITPRDLRFGIEARAERAWFEGDPVWSAIVDGFAVLLPTGERFFIRSLKHYAPDIADPAIRAGIAAFAAQEAFHTREHEGYNAALRSLGVDVDRMEASVAARLGGDRSPIRRLAATCAIEQITYAFSRFFLLRPDLMDRSAPAYRRLWQWHALEEVEHASVALAAYHAAPWSGSRLTKYAFRIAVMNVTCVAFAQEALRNAAEILRGPGARLSARQRLRLAWALFGSPGFAYALLRPYLAYLRPGYRGGGGHDARLVETGRKLVGAPAPA